MSSTATDPRVSTRSMPMEERIGKLEGEILRHDQDLREIKEFMVTMATKFDSFIVRHKDPQEADSYSVTVASTRQEGLQALCVRFGPSEYEDFDEAFAKLRQIGTVREYQVNFEKLATRVRGWTEKALVGSFIGGLKEEIRCEVKLFKPITMLAAVGLARMQEEKLQKQWREFKPPPPDKTENPVAISRMTTGCVPFNQLTGVEMQARRENGLCYNCDEKITPGHRCKAQQIFLLKTSIDGDNDQEGKSDGEVDPSTEAPILIDSDSTHNFVNVELVARWHYPVAPTTALQVMVVDGNRLKCKEIYCEVPMELQGYRFTTDMYPLELKGANVVLGLPEGIHSIQLMLQTGSQAYLMQIVEAVSEVIIQDVNNREQATELDYLYCEFHATFGEVCGLPPRRDRDHQIQIQPPANVRPYRYPRILKHNLLLAHNRMKVQRDRHRRELEFAEKDWVYLKLQPYRQVSIRGKRNMKLAPRFYDPFCALNRQVVKSDSTTIKISELDFEIPLEAQRGTLSTVERILLRAVEELQALHEERKKLVLDTAEAIDQFLIKLKSLVSGNSSFTLILDDPAGNNYIENPFAPSLDPSLTVRFYERTREQQALLGFMVDPSLEELPERHRDNNAPSEENNPSSNVMQKVLVGSIGAVAGRHAIAQGNIEEIATALCRYLALKEVDTFPSSCGTCGAACVANFYSTKISYFQEVIIMTSSCDLCGYRNSELKPGGEIPKRGKRITAHVQNIKDLSRDVIKSDTTSVRVPELQLELSNGTLGGIVTTAEGLVTKISENFEGMHGFNFGDSVDDQKKQKWQDFKSQLRKILDLKEPWTLIIEPAVIIEFRWTKQGRQFVKKVLVQWTSLSVEEATWKVYQLQAQFPYLNLEGKVRCEGGRNVSTGVNWGRTQRQSSREKIQAI